MRMLVGSLFAILLGSSLFIPRSTVALRSRPPVAIAPSPAVIWLLAAGQLAEFSGFGLAFKLREATAKTVSLKLDGSKIEPGPISVDEKRGIRNIPELVQKRVAALRLELGRRGYYASSAIREYFDQLTRYDFFRYVVFVGGDGKFRGLEPAKTQLDQMRRGNVDSVRLIEDGALNLSTGSRPLP